MKKSIKKQTARTRRHARIRSRVKGTEARPRLAVFKSNRFLSAQIINDDTGVTLMSVTTKPKSGTVESAREAGKELALKAKKANITAVVFDRGGFIYAGKIKGFADAVREAGLTF